MPQKIQFEKMHGLGNDFVLIDNREQTVEITKELIVFLADRHKGIGFDQLLVLDTSELTDGDAAYRFFNPDGSQAEQCGNGQRCISKYLHRQNPAQKEFCVAGLAGLIYSKVLDNKQIQVNMGSVDAIEKISIDGKNFFQVLFGNPHLIGEFNDVSSCNLLEINNQYTQNYPHGINLEIVEIVSRQEINIRVYERGTGETMACGSGACAVVAALQNNKQLDNRVKVVLPGGTLVVEYSQHQQNYYLTGAAEHVFTGEVIV